LQLVGVFADHWIGGEGLMDQLNRGSNDFGGGLVCKAVVHPFALLAALDESSHAEDEQMLGDGGGGKFEQFDDLADAEFAWGERGEDADAIFVRQCAGDRHELEH
jgi:hypothetical protein